jgi:hypothetical protein
LRQLNGLPAGPVDQAGWKDLADVIGFNAFDALLAATHLVGANLRAS